MWSPCARNAIHERRAGPPQTSSHRSAQHGGFQMTWSWIGPFLAIVGLAVITIVSRSFFMIPERELPLPDWLKRGLKYAPLAALTAVIAPEILMTQGEFIDTFMDARLPAVLCASAYYFWRRGILGTIVVGMAVYLPLHIGWGW
jgi:branched-subunit amino acid transport protein